MERRWGVSYSNWRPQSHSWLKETRNLGTRISYNSYESDIKLHKPDSLQNKIMKLERVLNDDFIGLLKRPKQIVNVKQVIVNNFHIHFSRKHFPIQTMTHAWILL